MNNIYIYKEVTETRVGQRDSGSWLRRFGLGNLVLAMEMLSGEYDLPWAGQWQQHLDDPKWLGKAMVNTFGRLNDADQEMVAPLYEDWQWYFSNLDLEAAVNLGYLAEVYLLDRNGRRVVADGRFQTVLVNLEGATREEALCQLNRDRNVYGFSRWWC
jgi:hypothetical protein